MTRTPPDIARLRPAAHDGPQRIATIDEAVYDRATPNGRLILARYRFRDG